MIYDQAQYTEDDAKHEPLLSEKDTSTVEISGKTSRRFRTTSLVTISPCHRSRSRS